MVGAGRSSTRESRGVHKTEELKEVDEKVRGIDEVGEEGGEFEEDMWERGMEVEEGGEEEEISVEVEEARKYWQEVIKET